MKSERIDYQALIESLADGVEVDWAALDQAAVTDADRRRYGNLRLVARMAELHRTLALESPADEMAADANVMNAQPAPPPGAWGHLQIRERIAGGSFGDVYLARDPQLDREVALKLLRPSPRKPLDRLLEEGRTLARVRHPNVVTVYGADVRDGRAGLWMELIEGKTLAEWLRVHGPMGPGEVVAAGTELCRALAAVHASGLVHGDIKAQNVMREHGGRVVLMDFGAGRAQGEDDGNTGTPLYLAPEVLNREPATPRSDIYSLGVLLFNLLTGDYPCHADSLEGLKAAHADGARVYIRDLRPELPGTLVDTIERALDRDPARRFATPGEMERALTAQTHAQIQPLVHQGPAGPSTRIVVAAFALAAMTALAVGLAWMERSPVGRGDSIAVLPFIESSGQSSHLMAGLSRDVARELQQGFDIFVKSAQSTPRVVVAGAAGADTLGAAAILRGDATRTGDRTALRVVVERPNGDEWWSREYDVAAAGLPSLARQIAGDVAAAIGVRAREGAPAPSHQANYRAYDAYQRGRAEAEKRATTALLRSLEYFDQAAELDPGYAEPHAGKADSYIALGVPAFGGLSPLESRRLAKASALRALELNPNLVEAHTSLAFAAFVHDWDWQEAQVRFDRAFSINPQYVLAHHWYAEYLNEMGRFDEALKQIRVAEALDPLSIFIKRDIAWHYFCQGRYGEAVAQLRQTLTLDPDYPAALTLLARSLSGLGQHAEALAELERARPRISSVSYLGFRGAIEAAGGLRDEATRTMAELRGLANDHYVSPYSLALIHTALGQTTEALAQLEEGYRQQDTTMVTVNIDPRFEPLRNTPRFKALIAQMRFPEPTR